jgi:RHS repeat-associated protein
VASLEASTSSVRWYLTDHVGTPLLETDASGAVVWRAEYTPYGDIFAYRAGSTLHQPLRFPGQIAQDNSEAYYNVFRWYRSAWGRYSQADPIGIRGGTTLDLNQLYAYAADNPTINVDPTGLYTLGATCKKCPPPSSGPCSDPRSSGCIGGLFRAMRDTIRANKKCAKEIDSFSGSFNAADVIRSSFLNTGGPLVTCNADDCNPSKFGGSAQPSYNPLTQSIPACLSLYDSSNSLMHEVLHYFGVGDDTAQQRVILKSCYPGSEP